MLPTLLLALASVQATGGPLLRPGETVQGEITDDAPPVTSRALEQEYEGPPVLGRSFRVEVEREGPYRIELRSYFFDAYLVLRDADGNQLAEDDNGLIREHARIERELQPGVSYQVEACALAGERGPFELALFAGPSPRLAASERMALEIEDAQRAAEAVEEREGTYSTAYAHACEVLGRMLYQAGRFEAALPPTEEAIEVYAELHGPDHIYVGAALNQLAAIHFALGRLDDAKRAYERSLSIAEAVNGPEHESVGTALANLAALHEKLGEYEQARRLLERALAIRERAGGEEHRDVASTYNSIGAVSAGMGQLSTGLTYCLRSVEIYERLGATKDPGLASALHNVGAIRARMGDIEAASRTFERALALRREILGPEHPSTIATLVSYGDVVGELGDYETARDLLDRGLAQLERAYGPDHHLVGFALKTKATLMMYQEDPVEAERLLARAQGIVEGTFGPEHFEVAAVIDARALALRMQERYEEALELHERSLAIREASLGPGHPRTATGLNNLGLCLAMMGDPQAAVEPLERAVAISAGAQGPLSPFYAKELGNLGMAYHGVGRLAEARELHEQALGILDETLGPRNPDTANALYNLSSVLLDMRLERVAWQRLRRYRDAMADDSRDLVAAMSESERYLYLAHVLASVKLELTTAERLGDRKAMNKAYEGVLAWKGQAGRMLAASRERLVASASSEALDKLERLRACQSELSSLALDDDAADRDAYTRRLADLRQERNSLELDLNRMSRATEVEAGVTLAELRSSLPEHTAVADFFLRGHYLSPAQEDGAAPGQGTWGDPHVSVWITRPDTADTVHIDLGPAEALERAVRRFLDELASGELVAMRGEGLDELAEGDRSAGAALRRGLWDPLVPYLEDVDTLVVSPDGFLGALPFEAIPLADGSFAIEQRAFVYLQDLASLARREPGRASLDSALVVGGVDFDLGAEVALAEASASSTKLRHFASAWVALPATVQESEAVFGLHARSFGDEGRRLLLQGELPTEARLKRELPRYALLHLATHGFFQPEGQTSIWDRARKEVGAAVELDITGRLPGLLSGLICAGVNGDSDGEDGYLTAEEVGWLDLTGVELVVLSACETGLGRAQSGEGLIGLRRAFRVAGAHTVVSSLWSVQDESTARLMEDFYTNLWGREMGRLEALRSAQLGMLARNREEHGEPRPATWAAFVLSGEYE